MALLGLSPTILDWLCGHQLALNALSSRLFKPTAFAEAFFGNNLLLDLVPYFVYLF